MHLLFGSSPMRRLGFAGLLLFLLSSLLLPVWAEDVSSIGIPGESRTTSSRLEEARKRFADGRWPEGISAVQSLIDTSGSDLIPLSDGRRVAARWLIHAMISRADKKGLTLYRNRVNRLAERLLEQANDVDPAALYKLVEDFFCTPQAMEALDRLGDQAFERGSFAEAEYWWSLIVPLQPVSKEDQEGEYLAYPDPPANRIPRLRAKQLLARLFQDRPRWRLDLDAFRLRHGKETGKLAGRSGAYADILTAVATDLKKKSVKDDRWPTFAGDVQRGRVAPAPPRFLDQLGLLCRAGATWKFDLQNRTTVEEDFPAPERGAELDAARRLAFYPAVVGHLALVADATHVTAYDLRTGKIHDWYDAGKVLGGVIPSNRLPAPRDLRYSLTVAEGCVFARLGVQEIKDIRPLQRDRLRPPIRNQQPTESMLVCLGLTPGSDGSRARWRVHASQPGRKEYAVFEGAPIVHEGRVYIAATRFEGDRVITAIHCYAAHPEDITSPLFWRTDVVQTHELLTAGATIAEGVVERKERHRHHLLTLAGNRLVYCSHSGVIAALDLRSGRRCWAFQYPRRDLREPEDNPALRDLAPPLYADGKIYVAPADADRVWCLDPSNGASIWERDHLDVVHMLGVGSGRLIFTTWRAPRLGQLNAGGLRAVNADDGSDSGGWMLPDDGGGIVPFGRGQLIGDLVLWPTYRQPYGVFAVRQVDGKQLDNPTLLHRIPSGNVLYANGCLLVTDQQTMHAFVPADLLPDDDEQMTRNPGNAIRRADALQVHDQTDRALETLDKVRRQIATRSGHTAKQWRTQINAVEKQARLKRVEQAALQSKVGEAERDLDFVLTNSSPRMRLSVWLRLAAAGHRAGKFDEARALWRQILRDEQCRSLPVHEQGRPFQPAAVVAQRHLRQIGISPKEEQRLFDFLTAVGDRGRDGVVEVMHSLYPESSSVRQVMQDQSRNDLKAGRLDRGARRQMSLLEAEKKEIEVEPLVELAQIWERMGCTTGSQVLWRRLMRDHGDRPFPSQGIKRTVSEVARLQLDEPPGVPTPNYPVQPVLTIDLQSGEHFLPTPGAEGPVVALVFTARGEQLVARSRQTGEEVWKSTLPFVANWCHGLGHLVIVGGKGGLAAVEAFGGHTLWAVQPPVRDLYVVTHDERPFSSAQGEESTFSNFHLLADRVVISQDHRFLLAVDALTGRVLWRHSAPGAEFAVSWSRGVYQTICPVGENRLLLQASGRGIGLDLSTGESVWEFETPLTRWPRPPLVLSSEQVVLVPNADRIQLLDVQRGSVLWTLSEESRSLRNGEPAGVFPVKGDLMVVEPLNIGYRVRKIDRHSGRPIWDRPLFFDRMDIHPGSWVVSGDQIIHTSGTQLVARGIFDGRVRWQRSFPGSENGMYRLAQQSEHLLIIPDRVSSSRFSFRWLLGSLQWRVGPLPSANAWSVTCIDAATGVPVQRINLDVTRLALRTGKEIPSRVSVLPLLSVKEEPICAKGPRVVVDSRGILIGLGNQIRVLTSNPILSSK